MPTENIAVAKILNILSWVVLGLGVAGTAVSAFFVPVLNWSTAVPLVIALIATLICFVTMSVLARILKTVTWLYQLTWEQFDEIGDSIDELDGVNDGDDAAQCPHCGAILEDEAKICARCGKALPDSSAESEGQEG